VTIESPLTSFCKKRGISGQIKSAFGAYIRAQYADKLQIRESGETVHVLLNRMSEDDLEAAWTDFVKDLYSSLPKIT
jgi:hypothetical protein